MFAEMSSKVVLLQYVCDFASGGTHPSCKTAIVVKRSSDGFLSIQGYTPVHRSEKHKAWSNFQQAAKQLLGVPKHTSICMRFADPPHETIGSLSALLRQPSHLINLIAQPVHTKITSSLSQDSGAGFSGAGILTDQERKDPYCAFREKYCKGKTQCNRSGSIRDKCDFAEMNKLASQLAEVNICLQRTQQECDLIEKRCMRKLEEKFTKDRTTDILCEGAKLRKIEHSVSSSSYNSDSGKGSMTDAEGLEGVIEEEYEGECVDFELQGFTKSQNIENEEVDNSLDPEDKEVERLLQIARQLAQQVHHRHHRKGAPHSSCTSTAQGTNSTPQSSSSMAKMMSASQPAVSEFPGHSAGPSRAPDAPSEVMVRSSFRHGGAYVMWNPVSVDGADRSHGCPVLGYRVYLDQRLRCRVGGALASQVELKEMKDGCEYSVQVCTECEHCTSVLTPAFMYRHQETNTPISTDHKVTTKELSGKMSQSATAEDTADTPPTSNKLSNKSSHSKNCKVAKVHTWLKNGSYSDLGQQQSVTLKDHTHSQGHTSLNDRLATPHVRFADEEACVCADDAKSIGSSHTSGIVTDYPNSPKLLTSCCCQQCSSQEVGGFPTPSRHCGDEPGMFSGHAVSATTKSIDSASSESTLCPPSSISSSSITPPTPRATAENNTYTMIDGPHPPPTTNQNHHRYSSTSRRLPLASRVGGEKPATSRSFKVARSLSHLSHHSVKSCPPEAGERGRVQGRTGVPNTHERRPEAPTNVCVGPSGGRGEALEIRWKPVKRDRRGCSNGCYVLGYRVYINGSCCQSVDGALTTHTSLVCAAISNIQHSLHIHVRTRSMSAESLPSNTVTYQLIREHGFEKVTLETLQLETYV